MYSLLWLLQSFLIEVGTAPDMQLYNKQISVCLIGLLECMIKKCQSCCNMLH